MELEGEWKWMTFGEGGKESPIKEDTYYIIEQDKLIVTFRNKVVLEGTVEFDPASAPSQGLAPSASVPTDVRQRNRGHPALP